MPPLFALALLLSGPAAAFSPEALWEAWPSRRLVTTPAPCLRHAELVSLLRDLEARHRGRIGLEEVGRSVEDRPIQLLTLGSGPRRVLLWSQMHGDEPSATPALLDVAEHLLSGGSEAARILEATTVLLVPMLNPDGAERYARRNAQAIDINRDALALSTPEGRLLKSLRERLQPALGVNLHDQDRRTTVGETGVLATISLLAVAGDREGTMSPGRARAKRACAAVARALSPYVPGGIARYDEDWNPRAFGDNLTAWGTPVVLIESGGPPPGRRREDLTRLNFVALLTMLSGLAVDDLATEDPAVYEGLPRNDTGGWADVLIEGGELWQPPGPLPYRADVAFDLDDPDSVGVACAAGSGPGPSLVREVGDGRLLSAARRIDATDRLVLPALAASVRGLAAREWMTGDALDAIGRLGVARLRWHVEPAGRDEAESLAAQLGRPGRPAISVAPEGTSPLFLEIAGPPRRPKAATLSAALDALTGVRWRSGRPLGERLRDLTGGGDDPPLAPDAPASLLLLRPQVAGATDPDRLEIEAVFLDGREPALEP